MKNSTTARIVREARGGMSEPLFLIEAGAHLLLVDPAGVSVLSGETAAWMSAHLIDKGSIAAEYDVTGITIDGTDFPIPFASHAGTTVPPTETAPEPTPPPSPPSVLPEALIPLEALPMEPRSKQEWIDLIQGSPLSDLPTVEAPGVDEEMGAYVERVLLPLSLTLASAAHSPTFRVAVSGARHPTWDLFHASLKHLYPEQEGQSNE